MAHKKYKIRQCRSTLFSESQEKLNLIVILLLLLATGIAFFPMIRIFLVPIILAATFSTLFFPMNRFLRGVLFHNKPAASLVSCVVLFLGILIPALIIFDLVAEQAISLYGNANDWFKNMSVEERQGYWSAITSSRLYTLLRLDTVDWGSIAQQDFKAFGSLVTKVVNKTSQGVAGVITGVFITFFIMFYFFMDGEGLVRKLKYLSPLRNEYNNMIAERFALISRATVKGTVLIGLAQGSIGSLVLMIAGLNTWLLWGFVMVVLSIIPMVGAWLVLMPIAIFELLQGKIWQGLLILITCTVVVSNVDNLLRPRLVGRDAKLHDLMIFFSTLGGIALFGVMGFIVGPVIAALFVTILDIYAEEFKPQLSRLQSEDERNTL